MNKRVKKIFGTVIVSLVTLGLIAAYVPLLFVRQAQTPPPAPESQQVILPLIPNATSTPTSTEGATSDIELEGLTGFETEAGSLDVIDSLLDGVAN